jgi:hypothetical protein
VVLKIRAALTEVYPKVVDGNLSLFEDIKF